LSAPRITQPGPAAITAVHQPRAQRRVEAVEHRRLDDEAPLVLGRGAQQLVGQRPEQVLVALKQLGGDHRRPPAARVLLGLGRHEPQVVDLLTDLGDQRERDAGARAERDHREADAVDAAVVRPLRVCVRVRHRDHDEREEHADQPQRLRPHLHLRQQRHAEDHQRRDHQRRDRVPDPQRQPEPELEPLSAKKMNVKLA
jgi:hypothetical protein